MGRKFEIKTDHKPLIPILGQKGSMWFVHQTETYGIQFWNISYAWWKYFIGSCPCGRFNDSTNKEKALTNEVELFARSVADATKNINI